MLEKLIRKPCISFGRIASLSLLSIVAFHAVAIRSCWSVQFTFDDGSPPPGIPQLPHLMSGYPVRPTWPVAGVDYHVGTPTGFAPKSPVTISISGLSVDPTNHTVTVYGSDVILDGYDFSLDGGWGIIVSSRTSRLTVKNSYFKVGKNNLIPIDAYRGGVVELTSNTFDGGGSNGTTVNNMFKSGTGATIRYNRFTNIPDDAINIVNNGRFVIQYNLFDNLGFGDFHTDAIQSFFSQVDGLIVEYNTMYQPPSGGGVNSFVRIGDQKTNVVRNVSLAYNTLIFRNDGGSANVFQLYPGTAPSTLLDPTVHDNFIDPTKVLYAVVFFPLDAGSALINPTTYNNMSLITGKRILNGPYNSQTASIPANPPAAPRIISRTPVGSDQLVLRGTAAADSPLNVYNNGVLLGSTKSAIDGTWSFMAPLIGARHAFTARTTDRYFNTSAASETFQEDAKK